MANTLNLGAMDEQLADLRCISMMHPLLHVKALAQQQTWQQQRERPFQIYHGQLIAGVA